MAGRRNALLFIESDDETGSSISQQLKRGSTTVRIRREPEPKALTRNFFISDDPFSDYTYEIKPAPQLCLSARRTRHSPLKNRATPQKVFAIQEPEPVRRDEPARRDELQEPGLTGRKRKQKKKKMLEFYFESQNDESKKGEEEQEKFCNEVQGQQNPAETKQPENTPSIFEMEENSQVMSPSLTIGAEKMLNAIKTVEKGGRLETRIFKSRTIGNFLYPQFDVYKLEEDIHIISSRKQMANIGCNYSLSINPHNFSRLQNNYIGKMRSDSKDLTYNIFDEGRNPEMLRGNPDPNKKRRSILATIKLKIGKGPWMMEAFVLKQGKRYEELLKFPSQETNLLELYKQASTTEYIDYYVSRKPSYVEGREGYYMDFEKRVKVSSVRNFILEDYRGEEVLFMGKQEDNVYRMDISHPLDPRLALGIVMPMFEND